MSNSDSHASPRQFAVSSDTGSSSPVAARANKPTSSPDAGSASSSFFYNLAMVDFGFWGDVALRTWVNMNPSTQWANRQIEPYRGLPFGTYLHSARPRRPRTLTAPLDHSQESIWHKMQVFSSLDFEQTTNEQQDCAFLTRLPPDIRLIIYDFVLGGNTFHLQAANSKSRIFHTICKHPEQIENPSVHIDCSDWTSSAQQKPELITQRGLLALLLTCRKIYSEAVGALYSTNTFEFTQNFAAFTFLKIMLPPQRLLSIRHLRLHLRIPRHPTLNSRSLRDWHDLWTFFGVEMAGLQRLFLQLQMLQPMEATIEASSDDEAESWIRPMVEMAVNARQKRGCRVEIGTRQARHLPAEIFSQTMAEQPGGSADDALHLTCTKLHERIRLSLG